MTYRLLIRRSFLLCFFCLSLCGCRVSDIETWTADRYAAVSQAAAQTAARLYEKTLVALPEGQARDIVCVKLGRLYLNMGRFGLAIECLKNGRSPQSQSLLAEAFFQNGEYTRALDVFNRLGEEGAPDYLYYYAMTLEKSNLYDQALKIYRRIQEDPGFGARARERIALIGLSMPEARFSGVSPEVRSLIEKSPAAEAYPDASVLYLLADEAIRLTENFQVESELHYVVKILNDRGKEGYGEVTLPYDSTYETVELEYARTIRPDGTVISVGDKNIRDVSLYLNYPLYSNARARIISMPEVAPGCVIEYKVRILQTKLPNKKDFDSVYWLQMDEPVLLQRVSLAVPRDRQLRYKVVNAGYNTFGFTMTPQVRETGNSRIYALEFRDVPQIIPEPSMPPVSKINPYVLWTTFASWEEIYRWWRDLYQDKIRADAAIAAKVEELVKGKKTEEERIRVIYDYCAQEIRYVAVEYGDAGYEPHEAPEIFRNKYGDCKDKAILLVAMLKKAGIEAYPVLISTDDELDNQEDLPSLLFNHAIAAVKVRGRLVFMDATASTTSFGDLPEPDQDRLVLVFYPQDYELVKTPLFEPSHNRAVTKTKIEVRKDESILGERRLQTEGFFLQAQRYWLRFTMPSLIEESIKQRVRSISENGRLLDYTIKNADSLEDPVIFFYRFEAPRYFIKAGRSRIMSQMSGFDTSVVAREARRYPLQTGGLRVEEDELEVELPDRLAVKYLPNPVMADTPWFSLSSRYGMTDSRHLRYVYVLEVKRRDVTVEDYAEYKRIVEHIASQLNQQVILEEK
ncbi:DUF3857 domain-containing protein [Candidatus Velamenicoccus archaeovorus]|uniref:DUF3857 domain-containing protein n=1 Tax=Velamenicoccus archaeovorus TaxID=1930593 RepID=UPI000FFF53C2|nr:DUF3857 domain-containing protein [Candidatus Velamenicoccus archaeovorus]